MISKDHSEKILMHAFSRKLLGYHRINMFSRKSSFYVPKKIIKVRSRKKLDNIFAEITPIFISNMSLGPKLFHKMPHNFCPYRYHSFVEKKNHLFSKKLNVSQNKFFTENISTLLMIWDLIINICYLFQKLTFLGAMADET